MQHPKTPKRKPAIEVKEDERKTIHASRPIMATNRGQENFTSVSTTDTINVLIVDDHALLREGLRQLFALEDDIVVTADACDGFEALEKIRQHPPDIVLMDIRLPVMDGIAVTRQITQHFPGIKVIILTVHHQSNLIVDAMQSGARGYLLKSASIQEVSEAIRAVHRGDTIISPTLTGAIVHELRRRTGTEGGSRSEHLSQLSEKEIEIIRYLAAGLSNREIAARLSYSEKTVKNYLSVIFQKLQLRDRTQVAIFALRQGLLPDEGL